MAASQRSLAERVHLRALLVPRCTAAVANYALYLLGLGGATEAQLGWAREAVRNPGGVGEAVSWHLLNQPDYLDLGPGIADNVLTGAVETAINAHFIQPEV